MIPQTMEFVHDPPRSYGDCHRAAVASLLDLPIAEVPHFMDGLCDGPDDAEIFAKRERSFLQSLGLVAISMSFVNATFDDMCAFLGRTNPDLFFLVGGKTIRGSDHTIVAGPNGLVHDPYPLGKGLSGPTQDRDTGQEFFWVTYILAKIKECAQ